MSNQASNGNNGSAEQALQRCVSLANGALSPDLRVNYEFGLVLGVDEFRQEQLYFLEKDRLHQRALHGYGTAYGLGVTATRPPDATSEMLITVEPGLGVDQFGRNILLREEQCARLGAWLARQQTDGKAPALEPGDDYRVYVVASYDDCTDALVPIPGQPCSVAEDTQAPSRLRDAFHVELRWQAPPMTAWDAARAFADILARVRLAPGLAPELSDEQEVVALVRGLADPPVMELCDEIPVGSPPFTSPPSGSPPSELLRIPAEGARQALDRIFTTWVTEVRPAIRSQVNLSDPGDDTKVESGIVLACIDFAPVTAFEAGNPQIDHAAVSYVGRPYLLDTELIQEMLLLGNGEYSPNLTGREFATLQVAGSHTLRAWLHHPLPLDVVAALAPPLTLFADGQPINVTNLAAVTGTDNLYEITTVAAANGRLAPGARLELVFNLDAWQERGGRPLTEALDAAEFTYEGRDVQGIHLYGAVDELPPSRDLVTYSFERDQANGQTRLVAWFHTDQGVRLPSNVTVRRLAGGPVLQFATAPRPANTQFTFQWQVTPPAGEALKEGDTLIVSFDTNAVRVGSNPVTLTALMMEQYLSLVGYDGDHTVNTFYQIPPLPAQGPTGPSIDEIIQAVAVLLPSLTFVNILVRAATRPAPPAGQQVRGLDFELWFHLDLDPSRDAVRILEAPKFRAFAEVEPSAARGSPLTVDRFQLVDKPKRNVFVYFITLDDYKAQGESSPYLRFLFPVPENMLRNDATNEQFTLEEYVKKQRIKFEGHNGQNAIAAYVRIPSGGGVG